MNILDSDLRPIFVQNDEDNFLLWNMPLMEIYIIRDLGNFQMATNEYKLARVMASLVSLSRSPPARNVRPRHMMDEDMADRIEEKDTYERVPDEEDVEEIHMD